MNMRKLFAALTLLLCLAGVSQATTKEQRVSFTGTVVNLIPVGTPASALNTTPTVPNQFTMSVNQNNTATLFLTNETNDAGFCQFTVTMYSTSQANVASQSGFPQDWSTLTTLNAQGSAVVANTFTLPPLSTTKIQSNILQGVQLSVVIQNTGGFCSTPTLVDAQIVFNAVPPGNNQVQGLFATGDTATAAKPLIVGGLVNRTFASPVGIVGDSETNGAQWPIGSCCFGAGGDFQADLDFPGVSNAPLAVALLSQSGANGNTHIAHMNAGAFNQSSQNGIEVSENGYVFENGSNIVILQGQTSGSGGMTLWGADSNGNLEVGNNPPLTSCKVTLDIEVNTRGFSDASVQIWFQDEAGNDPPTINDRLAFPIVSASSPTSAATVTEVQYVGYTRPGNTGAAPIAPQNKALTAPGEVDGPMASIGLLAWNYTFTATGGGTPGDTTIQLVRAEVQCK